MILLESDKYKLSYEIPKTVKDKISYLKGIVASWKSFIGNDNFHVVVIGGDKVVTITSENFLTDCISFQNVKINEMKDLYVKEGMMGWWIKDIFGYTLYKFEQYDFIEGFIQGSKLIGKDFRDLIYGLPFKNKKIGEKVFTEYIEIIGYDIRNVLKSGKLARRPAPLGPFFTYVYEDYDTPKNVPNGQNEQSDYAIDYE